VKTWAMGLVALIGLSFGLVSWAADFNGDGTGEVAVFKASSGLWSVRGVTRIYMGAAGDIPVPGDYNGSGMDQAAIFRASSGLWSIRDVTRVYLGGGSDSALPGDYNGDRIFDIAIFRPDSGLWSVRDITRVYFGGPTDVGIAAGTVKASIRTINGSFTAQAAGYYQAFDLATVQPDLSSANIRSGITVFGVAGDPNVVDTSSGDAAASDIKSGKIAWVDGTEVTGTIPTQNVSASTVSQPAGYYDAFNLQTVDTDLAAGNIKKDVVIFGVTGTASSGGLLWTGQTTVYRTGDAGTYQTGTAFSYQTSDPAGNGEIVTTDNVTGLMWASDGNGKGCNFGNQTDWNSAIDWAEGLTFAGYSDWRLPNRRELESLIDGGKYNPAIDTTYFPNASAGDHWSGSTNGGNPGLAWDVYFVNGIVFDHDKSELYRVRAVRSGQQL